MSGNDKCKEILEIVPDTAVLAIDVAGWSDTDSPSRIARSEAVRAAINKELTKKAKALAKKHFEGKTISDADAVDVLKTIPAQVLDAQKKEAGKRLSCAFNETPIGTWIDKNNWVLYVFAPIVVGAAGTYMYTARTGDQPASWATSMAKVKKSFQIKHIGKLTLGTTDVTFVPSERDISVLAFGEMKWERVTLKLTLGGGVSDGSFSTGAFGLDVNTALSRNWDLKAGSTAVVHQGDWGGRSSVGFAYKGSGAASDLNLFFETQFSYGRMDAFQGMNGLKAPEAAGLNLAVGLRF